jgi:AcrR family transcriptional regulator
MTRQRRTPEEARGAILAAAEEIVRRQGVARLTIDAVAAQAGLSKGGTLHHFPSKDALIAGMVEQKAASLRAAIADHEARYGATPHARMLGALHHARNQCLHDRELPRAILVAAAEKPELMNPLKAVINDVIHSADHGEDADLSLTVMFATHGLLMSKMLNFDDLSEDRTARLFDFLETLVAKKAAEKKTDEQRAPARPLQPAGAGGGKG